MNIYNKLPNDVKDIIDFKVWNHHKLNFNDCIDDIENMSHCKYCNKLYSDDEIIACECGNLSCINCGMIKSCETEMEYFEGINLCVYACCVGENCYSSSSGS